MSDIAVTPQPGSPAELQRKRPPRAAYALPSLFTAGNIFLGYLSIVRTIEGAILFHANPDAAALDFRIAAQTIGWSFVLDGLDGRVARMTNTTSEFGKELDSLADIISFGIAPAILAYVWGVHFVAPVAGGPAGIDQLQKAGTFLAFLFLVCGAARLARFNVQKNPVPKNPGSPDKKYFVGLPIPAGAGLIASIIYGQGSMPLSDWMWSSAWMALLGLVSFLMVSTWRYHSFKELNFMRPRSPVMVVFMCSLIFAIWNWSQQVLLVLAGVYVASGVLIRLGGLARRLFGGTPRDTSARSVNNIA